MHVVVKLFGAIRESVGAKELAVELPEAASAEDLRRKLAAQHPVFDDFGERLAVSVNFEVAPLETRLQEGDEVAFLPPVSGGLFGVGAGSTAPCLRGSCLAWGGGGSTRGRRTR